LDVREMAPLLSTFKGVDDFSGKPTCSRDERIQMPSWIEWVTDTYSASVDERAMTDCFFDDHEIGPPEYIQM
jgi:hypothetical protein